MKRSPYENPYVLANHVGDWLHNWRHVRSRDRSYEEAPELRNITKGESLFRTRCSVCHTIGPGDGIFRAGPNLLGVTDRREHEWLDRWLAAPDEMLASGDPIAMELFEAYNQVSMPNLRLSKLERDYLLEYIATESRRVQQTFKIEAIEPPDPEGPSCCQKNEAPVIELLSDELERNEGEESSVVELPDLPGGSWISIGTGCLLGLLTIALRIRGVV